MRSKNIDEERDIVLSKHFWNKRRAAWVKHRISAKPTTDSWPAPHSTRAGRVLPCVTYLKYAPLRADVYVILDAMETHARESKDYRRRAREREDACCPEHDFDFPIKMSMLCDGENFTSKFA